MTRKCVREDKKWSPSEACSSRRCKQRSQSRSIRTDWFYLPPGEDALCPQPPQEKSIDQSLSQTHTKGMENLAQKWTGKPPLSCLLCWVTVPFNLSEDSSTQSSDVHFEEFLLSCLPRPSKEKDRKDKGWVLSEKISTPAFLNGIILFRSVSRNQVLGVASWLFLQVLKEAICPLTKLEFSQICDQWLMLLNLNLKLVSLLHFVVTLVGKDNIFYYRADIFGEKSEDFSAY